MVVVILGSQLVFEKYINDTIFSSSVKVSFGASLVWVK